MKEGEPAFRFVIACEDEGHFRACRALMRRCLRAVEWLSDYLADDCWTRERVTDAIRRFREQFPRRFGSPLHGGGKGPDAMMVRAQLLLWQRDGWPFDAGVIARDVDRQPRRRVAAVEELSSLRERVDLPKPILLAHPAPEIEAWFIAGFEPRDPEERARLQVERDRLGFDPTQRPHELTSKRQTDDRDAKRVLDALTGGDSSRLDGCLEADLAELCRRGQDAGLAEFITACQRDLLDAFGTRTSR